MDDFFEPLAIKLLKAGYVVQIASVEHNWIEVKVLKPDLSFSGRIQLFESSVRVVMTGMVADDLNDILSDDSLTRDAVGIEVDLFEPDSVPRLFSYLGIVDDPSDNS